MRALTIRRTERDRAGANDYNPTNGNLLYDADGNGAGGGIAFATLSNKPTLTAADFVVI